MSWNGMERRRFQRRRIPCKIFVFVPQEKIISTHTEDISEEGVRVIIDEKLMVDSIVKVELYIEDEPTICEGRIAWTSQCDPEEKLYNTGIEIRSREVC